MELRQLQYLRSVVRLGGVSRAAEQERVSQPSVSKQIRLLERELGVPLLHRVGRRVVPTQAGQLLAECAARLDDDLATTLASIQSLRTGLQGELRLCGTETVVDNLLPPVLAALRARGPEIQLRVEMLGTDDAVQRLLADEFDLAVVVLPLADSRLELEELLEEEILLVVPHSHDLAGRISVGLREALTEPGLLLSMHGRGLRGQLEQEAQRLRLPLQSSMELRSQQALLRLVALGAGVCFAPAGSVAGAGVEVVALPLQPRLTRRIGVAVRRGRHLSPAAQVLLTLLREAARKLG